MPVRIDEPIAVAAVFKKGHIQPRCFWWKQRKVVVESTSFMWRTTEGATHLVHFTAVSGRTLYELVFDTKDLTWRLKQAESGG